MTSVAGGGRASRPVVGGSAAVLVAATVWGTTGTATHFAPGVPAFVFGAVTFGLGGLCSPRRPVAAPCVPGAARHSSWVAPRCRVVRRVRGRVLATRAADGRGSPSATTVAIGSSPLFRASSSGRRTGGASPAGGFVATLVSVVGRSVVTVARSEAPGSGSLPLGLGSALGRRPDVRDVLVGGRAGGCARRRRPAVASVAARASVRTCRRRSRARRRRPRLVGLAAGPARGGCSCSGARSAPAGRAGLPRTGRCSGTSRSS